MPPRASLPPWLMVCPIVALLMGCAPTPREGGPPPRSTPPETPASTSTPDEPHYADWQPPLVPSGVNPYLDDVRAHRAAFRAKGFANYVYVLTPIHMAMLVNQLATRIEVREGKVTSARSLHWGGTPPGAVPTMDDLFGEAEHIATRGLDHLPASFRAEYDAEYGYLRTVDARARSDLSDTESHFDVACFSLLSDGCAPVLLAKERCLQVRGIVLPAGGHVGCGGFSIGLIAGADSQPSEVCCRRYSTSHDEISVADCEAVGGVESPCGLDTMSVGSSQERQTQCCRKFVR